MASDRNKTVVKFNEVSLRFKDKVIFSNFNFEVIKGEKVVVFGKSGMGKSTLLNLILGFVKPQKGKVLLFNKEVNKESIWSLRKNIAFVDQDVVMGKGLVQEVIDDYFSFESNKRLKPTQEKLVGILNEFELDENILTENIDQLSGGERQRVSLVLAILLDRKLILLDEATSSLDPHLKKLVAKKLLGWKDKTVIIVTHDSVWQQQKEVRIFDFRKKTWVQ